MDVVFVLVGLALLIIHLIAVERLDSSTNAALECKQVMHPWFTTKYPYAAFEFGCYRHGSETINTNELDLPQRGHAGVAPVHALPNAGGPKAARKFSNLLCFEIYNYTVADWSREAAISESAHKPMVAMMLAHANMTRLPDGILGSRDEISLVLFHPCSATLSYHHKFMATPPSPAPVCKRRS